MLNRMRNRRSGFTLIELLIVVAIIGIIAAILIPNLLDALQKAKQKRTVSDMRNAGTAWLSWQIDQVGAASAGSTKQYKASGFDPIDYPDLFAALHPNDTFFYMQELPQTDGWRNELEFARASNLLLSQVLIICSGGRDGGDNPVTCTADHLVRPFVATDYDQDIIWADGYFVQWPDNISPAS